MHRYASAAFCERILTRTNLRRKVLRARMRHASKARSSVWSTSETTGGAGFIEIGGQLALAPLLSPFVIRSRGFQFSPDPQQEVCYCGGRCSGKKNSFHGNTPISRSAARADFAGGNMIHRKRRVVAGFNTQSPLAREALGGFASTIY